MGKGGRGKVKDAATQDDDALLEQAMAQAALERTKLEAGKVEAAKLAKAQNKATKSAQAAVLKEAQAAKAAAQQGGGKSVLPMKDTLEKLDRVMTFTISRLLGDGSKDSCPSPSGAVTFYTDAADAKADLEAIKAADATAAVSLDYTPLGRAFALTQGLNGLTTPGPCKIQFSRALVERYGEEGVPPELQERMREKGPFPLYYSDKLGSEQFTPIFFTPQDLFEFWVTCNGDPNDLPVPTVTDLRIVVARTLNEPGNWEPLHYVPPKASEELTRELGARAQREEVLKKGFTKGTQVLKAVAHAVAVQDGDEPPVLQ